METYKCECIKIVDNEILVDEEFHDQLKISKEVVLFGGAPSLENLASFSFAARSMNEGVILKPTKVWKDSRKQNGYLVMCEVVDYLKYKASRWAFIYLEKKKKKLAA